MSVLQVSRLVRMELKERFSADFNDNLAAACTEFGIPGFALNFAQDPSGLQNFYEGNRSLDSLNLHQEPDLSAMTMWTGEGRPFGLGEREMPRSFSGEVLAHWRFFLAIPGLRATGLVDLREAVEAAVLATLTPEWSGLAYRGNLGWQSLNEQIWLDLDSNPDGTPQPRGWIQEVEYVASFEVNI